VDLYIHFLVRRHGLVLKVLNGKIIQQFFVYFFNFYDYTSLVKAFYRKHDAFYIHIVSFVHLSSENGKKYKS